METAEERNYLIKRGQKNPGYYAERENSRQKANYLIKRGQKNLGYYAERETQRSLAEGEGNSRLKSN